MPVRSVSVPVYKVPAVGAEYHLIPAPDADRPLTFLASEEQKI
nr:hypothetical protein [Flavobacterium marginilacus]